MAGEARFLIKRAAGNACVTQVRDSEKPETQVAGPGARRYITIRSELPPGHLTQMSRSCQAELFRSTASTADYFFENG